MGRGAAEERRPPRVGVSIEKLADLLWGEGVRFHLLARNDKAVLVVMSSVGTEKVDDRGQGLTGFSSKIQWETGQRHADWAL
jgi:hypothetical protein